MGRVFNFSDFFKSGHVTLRLTIGRLGEIVGLESNMLKRYLILGEKMHSKLIRIISRAQRFLRNGLAHVRSLIACDLSQSQGSALSAQRSS